MARRTMKIALGMTLTGPEMRSLRVDCDVVDEISSTLFGWWCQVLQRVPHHFESYPDISWDFTAADITGLDLVVYFVRSPAASIISGLGYTTSQAKNKGGATNWSTPWDRNGVISEVYIDGNFPAGRLAVCAFHELMHNKLQKDDGMHTIAGIGLGSSPSSECTRITPVDIQLMASRLLVSVPQFTGRLTGGLAEIFKNPPNANQTWQNICP